MGRQSRKHNSVSAEDLLSFHFVPAAVSTSLQNLPQGRSSASNRRGRWKKQQYTRSAQDRASARRRVNSANFYLHSSCDHAFALTRRSNSKVNNGSYSFSGCDCPVAWDSVRVVKQLVTIRKQMDLPSCPICLSEYVSPRITKCGHSFCLPCILHHVQSQTESNPMVGVKCPCCGIPLQIEDLRPVIIKTSFPPIANNHFRLRKLHRQKGCHAPYLPLPDKYSHSNPHTAPSQGDEDAIFSRFNYVDPILYQSLLRKNRGDIQQEMATTPQHSQDYLFLRMSAEILASQEKQALLEFDEERQLHERFLKPASGMYERQPHYLIPTKAADMQSSRAETCSNSGETAESLLDTQLIFRGEQNQSISSDLLVSSQATHPLRKDRAAKSKGRAAVNDGAGAMYLDEDHTCHFYQSDDGQLVFLNGFNMACLLADFSKAKPDTEDVEQNQLPLPDEISGKVLDTETVYLTLEARRRFSFLEHIPLYTDVVFVELDLSHLLSDSTKKRFSADLTRRKKRRQSKIQAEKKADREAKRKEALRIIEQKARLEVIDPEDSFFQPIPHIGFESQISQGDSFGPPLVHDRLSARAFSSATSGFGGSIQSFSEACRNHARVTEEDAFPALGVANAFPALTLNDSAATLNTDRKVTELDREERVGKPKPRSGEGKKRKGQKVVLFSTGGNRRSKL